MCFMLGADKYRFEKLIGDLENQHTQGMKGFWTTLSSAFGLINNWKNAPKLITKIIESDSDGIAFSQIDENKKEKQKQTKNPLATITCCKCQENGHYSHSCLKNKVTLRCCLMYKKLKTAQMKTNLHSSLWQYSANNQTQGSTKLDLARQSVYSQCVL